MFIKSVKVFDFHRPIAVASIDDACCGQETEMWLWSSNILKILKGKGNYNWSYHSVYELTKIVG